MKKLKAAMERSTKSEKEFSQNIFKNSNGSIYEEKKGGLSKEEEEKKKQEELRQAAIDQKNHEIQEEKEYLETLTNVQWFIYPFFKAIEAIVEKTIGCCKSERLMRNREPPRMKDD